MNEEEKVRKLREVHEMHMLNRCLHCGTPRESHANGQCLFEPTKFEPTPMAIAASELLVKYWIQDHDEPPHPKKKLHDFQRQLSKRARGW